MDAMIDGRLMSLTKKKAKKRGIDEVKEGKTKTRDSIDAAQDGLLISVTKEVVID